MRCQIFSMLDKDTGLRRYDRCNSIFVYKDMTPAGIQFNRTCISLIGDIIGSLVKRVNLKMIKLFRFIDHIKRIKSPYTIGGVGFLIWMLFVDAENFVVHYKMKMRLRDLAKEKQYYIDQKQLIEKERERINGDIKLLEKFARERYFMKRKNEDIYIIQEK